MGLDVKLPIGLIFTIFGLLLVIHGFTADSAIYTKSLGINVNLRWGAIVLIFGLIMLAASDKHSIR